MMQFHTTLARPQILKLLQRHSNCVLEIREINTSFGTLCKSGSQIFTKSVFTCILNGLKDNTNWIQLQKMVPKYPAIPLFRVSKAAWRRLLATLCPAYRMCTFCQEKKVRARWYLLSDVTVSFFVTCLFHCADTSSKSAACSIMKNVPHEFQL